MVAQGESMCIEQADVPVYRLRHDHSMQVQQSPLRLLLTRLSSSTLEGTAWAFVEKAEAGWHAVRKCSAAASRYVECTVQLALSRCRDSSIWVLRVNERSCYGGCTLSDAVRCTLRNIASMLSKLWQMT